MKKVLSLLVISIMMLSLAACGGGNQREVGGTLTIGDTTEMTGDWIATFQNNGADANVNRFIHGYAVVDNTDEGEYVIDETVVKDWDAVDNPDGTKTYTFEINKGLLWDDGVEVKADQYVGGVLLWNHYFIRDLGGNNTAGIRYVGHSEYADGTTNVFEGVNLIDEYTFSLTLSADNVPYFYELANVGIGPTRVDFWLGEDIEVLDDGDGAYFSQDITKESHEDRFNEARFNPVYPSSGPYRVESYDEASKTAVLKINENYAGDRNGQKPAIETVIYKRVLQETMMDELATGSVDLLEGILQGGQIDAGFDLVDQGGFAYNAYPRAGYGKITFVCDFGPTQFPEVRQAIAHLLDRDKFARTFTGGYGSPINGPFGEGQWFYQETSSELNSRINHYDYNAEKAVELLEEGGWVYTATGDDWTPGSGPRHKEVDGDYMPLVIQWASSEQNEMSDLLVIELQENPDLIDAGIVIEQTQMTFTELLNWYYRDGSQDSRYEVPTYHMFNLATGFTPMYDLTRSYSQDPSDIAMGNNVNFIYDDQLEAMAAELVLRDPEDRDGFKEDWVEFIVYWNELLPDLPLYSNIMHDFYNDKIQDWNKTSMNFVHQAVLYAYVSE